MGALRASERETERLLSPASAESRLLAWLCGSGNWVTAQMLYYHQYNPIGQKLSLTEIPRHLVDSATLQPPHDPLNLRIVLPAALARFCRVTPARPGREFRVWARGQGSRESERGKRHQTGSVSSERARERERDRERDIERETARLISPASAESRLLARVFRLGV